MKTEITPKGWKEITIKHFRVRKWGGPLMLVDDWIRINERIFLHVSRRHRCDLCRKKWRDIPLLESVNVVFMHGPNKMICDSCLCKLKASVKLENS